MAEMYGKIEGCSLGRGGSMHLFDVSKLLWRQCYRQQSLAVGMALAKKQKKDNITCCFGEGAAAEGEFHEAMNLAALWEVLCYLFVKTTYTPWERRLDTPIQ
jgi:TPP-dependent pyruvate/acetoin dehydrogenase alpha subunit